MYADKAPSEVVGRVPVEGEGERTRAATTTRDKDRSAGLGRRGEREPDPSRRLRDDGGRAAEDRPPRERDAPPSWSRDRHRPTSSAPETPVTDDSPSIHQRETLRPGDSLRPEPVRKESETRDALSEVPLPVQEAWICEDLGYVLQVRRAGQVIDWQDSDGFSGGRASRGRSFAMTRRMTGRTLCISYEESSGPWIRH